MLLFLLLETGFLSKDAGSPTQENRCLYPFKRSSGEVRQDTRRRSDARRILSFSGSAAANLIPTDWATAGVQPEGGWRVFGYFLHEQKVPRPWVREPTGRGPLLVPSEVPGVRGRQVKAAAGGREGSLGWGDPAAFPPGGRRIIAEDRCPHIQRLPPPTAFPSEINRRKIR